MAQTAADVAQQPIATGPLDVYSEERWEYLQSLGYVWDVDMQRGTLKVGEYTIIGFGAW